MARQIRDEHTNQIPAVEGQGTVICKDDI